VHVALSYGFVEQQVRVLVANREMTACLDGLTLPLGLFGSESAFVK